MSEQLEEAVRRLEHADAIADHRTTYKLGELMRAVNALTAAVQLLEHRLDNVPAVAGHRRRRLESE